MSEENESHIALSWPILTLLIGSAISGGAGIGTSLGPQLQQSALQACFDNSERAIEVAVQHGGELQSLRRFVETQTSDRYLGRQALEDWRQQYRVNDEIFRRLEKLEE